MRTTLLISIVYPLGVLVLPSLMLGFPVFLFQVTSIVFVVMSGVVHVAESKTEAADCQSNSSCALAYSPLIVTSGILCAQTADNAIGHLASHVEPDGIHHLQSTQQRGKPNDDPRRKEKLVLGGPDDGHVFGRAKAHAEKDEQEADLPGDEPRDEEEDKGGVGECWEGEVAEHFGELQGKKSGGSQSFERSIFVASLSLRAAKCHRNP